MFELKKTVNFNLVTDVLGRIKVQMGISNITGLVFYGDIFLQLPRKTGWHLPEKFEEYRQTHSFF